MKRLLALLLVFSTGFLGGSYVLYDTKDWGTIRQATYTIGDPTHTACSATKISEAELLTAAHCLSHEDGIYTVWDQDKIVGIAVEVRRDNAKDLGLLQITSGVEGPYASVASQEPLQDTIVVSAGTPLGITEVLTEGVMQGLVPVGDVMYVAATASVSFGNSGGGLWVYRPWHGWELLGVTSMVADQYGIPYNQLSFYVNLENIKAFLKAE
jgi:S1-C subfamily serine protease